jgi:hypothetical protein
MQGFQSLQHSRGFPSLTRSDDDLNETPRLLGAVFDPFYQFPLIHSSNTLSQNTHYN